MSSREAVESLSLDDIGHEPEVAAIVPDRAPEVQSVEVVEVVARVGVVGVGNIEDGEGENKG